MARTKDEEFVTFLNSAGEEVSNDPRWKAKRVLENAGIASDQSEVLAAKDAEIEELKRRLAEAEAAPKGVEEIEDDGENDETEDQFQKMGGAELKAYAKENDIDIKGLKTVGQVRAALRAAVSE